MSNRPTTLEEKIKQETLDDLLVAAITADKVETIIFLVQQGASTKITQDAATILMKNKVYAEKSHPNLYKYLLNLKQPPEPTPAPKPSAPTPVPKPSAPAPTAKASTSTPTPKASTSTPAPKPSAPTTAQSVTKSTSMPWDSFKTMVKNRATHNLILSFYDPCWHMGSQIYNKDENGCNILMLAILAPASQTDKVKNVNFFIERMSSFTDKDNQGNTAFMLAQATGNEELINLFNKIVPLNTQLFVAIDQNNLERVQELLLSGANKDFKNALHDTPLSIAKQKYGTHATIVKALEDNHNYDPASLSYASLGKQPYPVAKSTSSP